MRLVNRAAIPSGVYTTAEAMQLLNIGETRFANEKSKLIPSRIKGKWKASSVHKLFKELHGFPYDISEFTTLLKDSSNTE